jgi:P27 family predicted phage terminase small subunit
MVMPRKTVAEHELAGTIPQWERTPEKKDEDSYEPGRPKFPKDVPPKCKPLFKRLVAMLEARRVLTEGDSELLRIYCVAFDRHARATERLAVQGEICVYSRLDSNGKEVQIEKPNHWLKVQENAEKTMLQCIDRLGLSPLNRTKVKQLAAIDALSKRFPGWERLLNKNDKNIN